MNAGRLKHWRQQAARVFAGLGVYFYVSLLVLDPILVRGSGITLRSYPQALASTVCYDFASGLVIPVPHAVALFPEILTVGRVVGLVTVANPAGALSHDPSGRASPGDPRG